MSHQCPVCAFEGLVAPPADFEICPCCGTEFGLDDHDKTHAHLRADWINNDYRWFSRANPAPLGWDPIAQLVRGGHITFSPSSNVAPSKPVNAVLYGRSPLQVSQTG